MIGYVVFFLILFLTNSYVKNKDIMLLLSFFVIFVFSALRDGIGFDYYSYLYSCMPGSYSGERFEIIPRYFVHLSQNTFPYLFFILSSLFISLFNYLAIRNGGVYYFAEIIFYIGFPFLFFNQLGIVRQAMASAVVFYALTLDKDARLVLFKKLALIILAFSCHHSAIIAILMLVPWQKVSYKVLWIMLFSSFFLGLFISSMAIEIVEMDFLDEETSARALKYLNRTGIGEGNLVKYLIYFTSIVALLLYKKLVSLRQTNAYYIGILVLGTSIFALFDYNMSIAKRFCMFFFSVSIFIVPQVIRYLKISKVLYYSVCVMLFAVNIYVGRLNIRYEDKTGESASYPYRTYLDNYLFK